MAVVRSILALALVLLAGTGCLDSGKSVNQIPDQIEGISPPPQPMLRTLEPAFSPDVPADVRSAITALLAAYSRGDGEAVYGLLQTQRERVRIVNAVEAIQIPIMNPRVASAGTSIVIDYELPHPGDLIAADLRGGQNLDRIRRNLQELRSDAYTPLARRETWKLIRTGHGSKVDYHGSGVFRYADLLGTDLDSYCRDVESKRFGDASLFGTPLSNRVTFLMSDYFIAFKLDIKSPENSQLAKEMLDRIAPIIDNQTVEVVRPRFTIEIPATWRDVNQVRDMEDDDGIYYAVRTQAGGVIFLATKEEVDLSRDNDLARHSDEELLMAAAAIDRMNLEKLGRVNILDVGKTSVDDVPAIYTVASIKSADEPAKRLLKYLFMKQKKVYSLSLAADEQEYETLYSQLIAVKDSFHFRRVY